MIKFENEPTLYTIEEASKIIKLSYQSTRKLILTGKLAARKVGRTWYIKETDLKELALGSNSASSVVSNDTEPPRG